jgi:hypothetical protein
LAGFLLSFLSSPYSIEAPLLILGHPGSGKSLLTKVLCAKLISETYTAIRVSLRDVENPESQIENLIEEQIGKDIKDSIKPWADFSRQFTDRPLLIILDGYDELLQASGKVFADYLQKVQKFQESEKVQERPVRVIVTSRVALIDKATVPEGATVVRLLEFNEKQRNAWISVWNKANADYFKSCDPVVEPFTLPEGGGNGKRDKVLELAKQPLLLLMLALYDSEGNSLRKNTQLDRTVLYDSLLRRFVWRERRRYIESFEDLPKNAQKKAMDKEIDKEMKRLGAAAIGMYNRRTLFIHSDDLICDFKFFEIERKRENTGGRDLTDVDAFLGGFFFIHKAKSGSDAGGAEHTATDFTFEFLHNTFGEFLTADFVLQSAFHEVEMLRYYKQNASAYTQYLDNVKKANALSKEWFSCLMYAPLYSRPVVPDMLREWAGHLFSKKQLSRNTFLECLDEILKGQVKMVLESRVFPEIMRTDHAAQFVDMPMLGLIATYTLNLIVFRTILDEGEFTFEEQDYSSNKEQTGSEGESDDEQRSGEEEDRGTRPWDRLAQIWRSWFKIDNLSGLCTILSAKRDGDKIILNARDDFRARPVSGHLSTVINVAAVLADDTTVGLGGLYSKDSDEKLWLRPDEIKKRLDAEDIDLSFEFLLRRLRQFLAWSGAPSRDVDMLISKGLRYVRRDQQPSNLIVSFFDLLFKALDHNCLSWRCEREVLEVLQEILDPRGFRNLAEKKGIFALQAIRLVRRFGRGRWPESFGEEFFERAVDPKRMHPDWLLEMVDRQPELAIAWLCLAREFGGNRWRSRFGEEFLEHFMHRERLMAMVEIHPEVAIEWLRLAREFGGDRLGELFGEEFFKRAMHPKRLMELFEMRPEVAIEWLRLVQEFGGGRWVQHYVEAFFERAMEPKHMHPKRTHRERLMEMVGMRPEVAIEWLRLVREFGGDRWGERYIEEFLERTMHPRRMHRKRMHRKRTIEMVGMRPEVAIEWLRLVREFGGARWLERIGEEFFERAIYHTLSRIPLEYVGDIKWYAKITHNVSLMEKIQTYMSSAKN